MKFGILATKNEAIFGKERHRYHEIYSISKKYGISIMLFYYPFYYVEASFKNRFFSKVLETAYLFNLNLSAIFRS